MKVLLEDVEGDTGLVKISKRKADRIINWEAIMKTKKEGEPVSGKVTKKIKGGLLVDIGVPVFLPASQVDIRRPGEISDWIGRNIDAVILKIDEERRNIVISRRKLIEQQREELKKKTFESLQVGQLRKGTVKNIADFGAFIDLGGIDGLLHITDMSWGRINHPSEMVKIDQEVEVKVLNIDKEKEKIALGLKQKDASPVGEHREQVPGRLGPRRQRREHHELRGLLQARGGRRGVGPHLRDELDQADQPPVARWSPRTSRSRSRSWRSTRTSRRSPSA